MRTVRSLIVLETAAFAGQRDDAATMPRHDDVQPQCLEYQKRDPKRPPTHYGMISKLSWTQ
jgi:hypothetical protein